MSDERRLLYQQRALEARAEKSARLYEDIRDAAREVRAKRDVADSPAKAGSRPCRLSDCRLRKAELEAFDAMWDDGRFARERVENALLSAQVPLGPLLAIEGVATWAPAGKARTH